LTEIAGSPFAAGWTPNSVAVDPAGKFAYVANGSDHNISAYAIDSMTGVLAEISGSPFAAYWRPFSIAIDASGKFMFVGDEGNGADFYDAVNVYLRNKTTGGLMGVAGSPFHANGSGGMSVAVDPSGQFFYSANYYDGSITALKINSGTGELAIIAAYRAGVHPTAIAAVRIAQ
jgi:DNA-binding beta-propeller fold protein YncE